MCKTIQFHKRLTEKEKEELYNNEGLFKKFMKENENNEKISALLKKYAAMDEELMTSCFKASLRAADSKADTEENQRKMARIMQMGRELATIKADILEKY